jgi:demethylmenaquinone methyltransferase/2-methoxy-6-polyprenyl-1,4-benzoquinol methylase
MADPTPAWDDKLLQNPHAVADKRRRVQQMFAAIAPKYDLNNRLHSFWRDQAWRRKAVKLAKLMATDVVVDVACGTGDLAFKFYDGLMWATLRSLRKLESPCAMQVIGVDFTWEMLPRAAYKARTIGFGGHVGDRSTRHRLVNERGRRMAFVNGDAQALPLPDASADVVSIAFGIRNVQDVNAALREFHRVLRPGGRLIILEFSRPRNRVIRYFNDLYCGKIMPHTATWISGDKSGAYKYLPMSVQSFIDRDQMMAKMREAGFTQVEPFPMTFGVCVCYRGIKA